MGLKHRLKAAGTAASTAALVFASSLAGTFAGNPHPTIAATRPAVQQYRVTAHETLRVNTTASASVVNTEVQLAPTQAISLYLPVLLRSFPLRTIFGIETTSINNAGAFPAILSAGATIVRRNALLWSDVEPTPGARNWAAVAGLEQELQNAAESNVQTILIVRGTPAWAQAIAGSSCGPVAAGQFAAFGAFLRDAAQRYANRVAYLEIGNEPDVPINASSDPYGCWGNQSDPFYYGGGAFGQMLTQVYPQIKAVNTGVKVLIGGLLLDCDPRNPPAGKDCRPSKFLEGILKAGAANSFDGVSFHAYDFSSNSEPLGHYSNSSWASAWNTTGPVVAAKARFLREVLAQNGAINKILINTETALICYACSGKSATFEESKAYYVPQAYAAAFAEGLTAQIWYSWQGWNNSDLGDPAFPQAKTAYTVARQQLAEVAFIREVTGLNGVKAYEFQRGSRKLWVAWSLDGAAHTIALPAAALSVKDVYGAAQPAGGTVDITLKPLYIELP